MRTLWHWLRKIPVVAWKDISNGTQISWAHLKVIWWLKYLVLIIVIVVALAIWAQGARSTEDPNRFAEWLYNFLNDWAIALGAAVTFMLAVAAFLAILDNRHGRRVDRRERLLNEILDWATNIAKSRSGKACKELIQITDSSGEMSYKKSLQFIHADIVEIKESFVGIESQSRYISKIALTFGAELHKTTEAVTEKIDEYVNYLNDWQNALADDIAKQKKHVDLEARVSKADEIGLQMDRSAIKLMEEVAEIKTRDIT